MNMENREISAALQLVQQAAQLLQSHREETDRRHSITGTASTGSLSQPLRGVVSNGSTPTAGTNAAVPSVAPRETTPRSSLVQLTGGQLGRTPTSQGTASASRSFNVVEEMRRTFAPYPSAGRGVNRRRSLTSFSRPGSHTFHIFCLGNPDETTVPSTRRKLYLQQHGLGRKDITLLKSASAEDLEMSIRHEFTQLNNVSIELLRQMTSHGRQIPLIPFSTTAAIPAPDVIIRARYAVTYVRPSTNILPMPGTESIDVLDSDNDSTDTATTGGDTGIASVISIGNTEVASAISVGNPEVPSSVTSVGNTEVAAVTSVENTEIASVTENAFEMFRNGNPELTTLADARESLQSFVQRSVQEANNQLRIDPRNSAGFNFQANPSCSTSSSSPAASGISNIESHYDDCVSIEEFRERMLASSGGGMQQIIISRTGFDEQILGIYKAPDFNFNKKTFIHFITEAGHDVNALTREFFAMAFNTLKFKTVLGAYRLFEGEEDHLVPTTNSMLHASGLYNFIGKLMGHAALQTGIGFVGISSAVIAHIFRRRDETENDPITIHMSDVPDHESRDVILMMTVFAETGHISPDNLLVIQGALAEADIFLQPSNTNIHIIIQQYMIYKVLTKRHQSLESIRQGLKSTGVFLFLQQRPYLWESVFPSKSSLSITADDINRLINFTGSDEDDSLTVVKAAVFDFIGTLDDQGLSTLIQAWTGWPYLRTDRLVVNIIEYGQFTVHACFNQMSIPKSYTSAQIQNMMRILIEDASVGFGAV